ncbi:ferredoxin [Pseudonocardia sp.]|uniref:ferredoxin n=1 Tax=Pseudonocardia sp. TaxID=60912 RepID=UPI003D128E20
MSNQKWRIEVSRGCIGAGLCLALAPEHFEFVGARATATTDTVEVPEALERVRAAAGICPASAISVSEE